MTAPRRASWPDPLSGQSAPPGEGEGVSSRRSRRDEGGPRGTARDRALRLLGFRARSRRELRDRLLRAGFGPSEVEDALDGLEAVGLIDDERFAQAVVEHAVGVRLSGRRAVMAKLLSQGVPREVAERAVLESAGDERLQAEELARRRAGRLAGLDSAVAFRRLSEFLVRRGYGMGVAREAARRALALDQSVEE